MKRVFELIGKIFTSIIGRIIGIGLTLIGGIFMVASVIIIKQVIEKLSLPIFQHELSTSQQGLLIGGIVMFIGAVMTTTIGVLLTAGKFQNPLLYLFSGILLMPGLPLLATPVIIIVKGVQYKEEIYVSIILFLFGLVFATAVYGCFDRAYLYWRRGSKSNRKKGGNSN